jgi:K+-transporting ATPase ATPase A chain
MTVNGWLQIGLFSFLVLLLAKPVGLYLYRVYEGVRRPLPRVLGPVERLLFRLSGVDPDREQDWKGYALSLLAFSALGLLVTYAIQRLQGALPLNPNGLPAVPPELAFNTAASFTTNTDWQSYGGEYTMSHFTQMAGLAWHNFTSAAAGVGVALALARGLTRHRAAGEAPTLGSFWADLVRGLVYVFLPASVAVALFLASQGVVQTLAGNLEVQTLEGARQVVTLGPVASQEAIKMLGTNGGGFFNANSAHPFENSTPLSNLVQQLLVFAVPAGLTYTFGRMARDTRQGGARFAAMAALYLVGVTVTYGAESTPNPALSGTGADPSAGNLEGK